MAWDRYAYSYNNPLKYSDPTGHWPDLANLASTVLSIGATVLDTTAFAISVAGTIIEGLAAVGGEAVTPVPAVDGAVGVGASVVYYNTVLNPIENALSAASFTLVAAADVVSGQTHFETVTNASGNASTELVFGPDTTYSMASITVGNTALTPEAATDTIANAVTLYYDFTRLAGKEPIWGLYEFRVGHDQNSDWFHGWYTRFNKKTEQNHSDEIEAN